MRHILIISLSLLIIIGCSKPLEDSTLINKDGLMYSPDSDKPYTGEVFINYSTGEKLYQGTYENGLLIDYSYLNEDGSVKEPINYETTLVERDNVFYTKDTNKPYSGPVFSLDDKYRNKRESLLEDGKMITYVEFDWYGNGQKGWEVNYKDGKEDGLYNKWHYNGQKQFEQTWKDGKLDGLLTEWRENGQKSRVESYKDGKLDGLMTRWYDNGQKKYKGNLKNGKKDGLWTVWYENGKKKYEGLCDSQNNFTNYSQWKAQYGMWTYWDIDGKKYEGKVNSENYEEDGKFFLINEENWDGMFRMVSVHLTYKDGKLDGLMTGWWGNGQKQYEKNYKNGKKDGLWKYYDENGKEWKRW